MKSIKEKVIKFMRKNNVDYARFEYWRDKFMEFFKIKEEDLK